jgi:hypothetical protein
LTFVVVVSAKREHGEQMLSHEIPVHSVGTVARMLGVSVFSLRMPERDGVILSRLPDTRNRRYSLNDVDPSQRPMNELKFGMPGTMESIP